MSYVDFTITIVDDKNLEVTFEDTTTQLDVEFDSIAMLTVDRMSGWITFGLKHEDPSGKDGPLTLQDLKVIGLNLYRILFFEKVRKRFEPAYADFEKKFAKDKTLRFRLKLVCTPAAERLNGLPWEFLYIPTQKAGQDGFFFSGEKTQLILSRSVPASDLPKLETTQEELRILVVLSSPKIPGTIQLTELEVEDLLKKMRSLKNTQMQVLQDAKSTITNLNDKFGDEKFNPHIVHFIGHGEAGELAFVKAKEDKDYDEGAEELQPRWVTGEQLRKFVQNWQPRPRLIFLHSCKGATPGAHAAFNSCARELVFADVPVVAAMQYSISNADAAFFAQTFYEELGRGHDVDEAVKVGRLKLGGTPPYWAHPRFGTPVVYLRADAGPIVLPAPEKDSGDGASQTADSTTASAASRVGTPIGAVASRQTSDVPSAPAADPGRTRTGFDG